MTTSSPSSGSGGTPSAAELADLRAGLRALLAKSLPTERVRKLAEGQLIDDALWRSLIDDFGLAAMAVPESLGGLGAGDLAMAVVAEELGRALAAIPFLSTTVLATGALISVPDSEVAKRWLPRLLDGTICGAALTGSSGRPGYDELTLTATTDSGASLRLSGSAGFALDADSAAAILVAARSDDGPVLAMIDPERVEIDRLVVHDRTRRLSNLWLGDVRIDADEVLAVGTDAERLLSQAYLRAGAALASDAAGGACRIHETAVRYAKERTQFGRPIGSFQAVKHQLADAYLQVRGASAASRGAAAAVSAGDSLGAHLSVSFAKDAYTKVAGTAVQVHGGIGYTWEHDCHLFFKRAQLDQELLGNVEWHRRQAGRSLVSV
ncbi:acyl-CoA dehydrogenase family protein [Nocardia sp. NPDC052278]|uniref:acyl-CoA dehydrogenase family protein n=1 Tax=unclassified Nocardia TaxID=2637762 RepID=UPI0036807B91